MSPDFGRGGISGVGKAGSDDPVCRNVSGTKYVELYELCRARSKIDRIDSFPLGGGLDDRGLEGRERRVEIIGVVDPNRRHHALAAVQTGDEIAEFGGFADVLVLIRDLMLVEELAGTGSCPRRSTSRRR